jgi:hypothetical protein
VWAGTAAAAAESGESRRSSGCGGTGGDGYGAAADAAGERGEAVFLFGGGGEVNRFLSVKKRRIKHLHLRIGVHALRALSLYLSV